MPKVPSDRQSRPRRESSRNAAQTDDRLFIKAELKAILAYVFQCPQLTDCLKPSARQSNECLCVARSLADRIERPPLRQRITEAPPPITLTSVVEKLLLDFKKLTPKDLM